MNKFPPVIGIAGKMRAGKTTVAKMIAKCIGHLTPVYIVPFAEALKEDLAKYGWDGQKDIRGRRLLQTFGTDAIRAYNPQYWVVRWCDKIIPLRKVAGKCVPIIIADDIRFPNEIEAVRLFDGMMIFVQRPDCMDMMSQGTSVETLHISENAIKDIKKAPEDVTITNDYTLDDLEYAVSMVIHDLIFRYGLVD